MIDAPAGHSASYVRSVAEYERRLRRAMRLMDSKTRATVVQEIVGGISIQVQAAGGDFARVAGELDDPAWVGRQMAQVYGAGPIAKLFLVLLGVLLGAASVPGLLAQPADSPGAIVVAFAAFALLVGCIFVGAVRISSAGALLAAAAAGAVRFAGLFIAVAEFPPVQTALPGELALYVLATGLLFVVAGFPALVTRSRAGSDAM